MSEPFLGEVRLFAFNFPPRGWATCDGQLLPIAQNQALFSILGTTYGGDGRVTFALPDLRGRVPLHVSAAHPVGERAGTESHRLTVTEIPPHTHALQASTADATERAVAGLMLAVAEEEAYAAVSPTALMGEPLSNTGGGQPHPNLQPYLVLNFCISLTGIFPSRN